MNDSPITIMWSLGSFIVAQPWTALVVFGIILFLLNSRS